MPIFAGMPTDAERWRFLADHRLTLHIDSDGLCRIQWWENQGPGMPPRYYPIAKGCTPEEAIDAAILKWIRKQERIAGGMPVEAHSTLRSGSYATPVIAR